MEPTPELLEIPDSPSWRVFFSKNIMLCFFFIWTHWCQFEVRMESRGVYICCFVFCFLSFEFKNNQCCRQFYHKNDKKTSESTIFIGMSPIITVFLITKNSPQELSEAHLWCFWNHERAIVSTSVMSDSGGHSPKKHSCLAVPFDSTCSMPQEHLRHKSWHNHEKEVIWGTKKRTEESL